MPYARRTTRLTRLLIALTLELGGEAGARGLAALGVPVRGATLLHALGSTEDAPASAAGLRVLGVDDWAVRRGQVHGTILVDLERHQVVDLLPGRDSETLAAWLRQHPEVAVICRDRQGAYAAGSRLGAPQAPQHPPAAGTRDRWHLLHNRAEVLEELLLHHRAGLRQAAEAPPASQADAEPRADAEPPAEAEEAPPATQERYRGRRRCSRARQERLEEASRRRHDRIVEQYEAIRRLHAAGADVADIAARTPSNGREAPMRRGGKAHHSRRCANRSALSRVIAGASMAEYIPASLARRHSLRRGAPHAWKGSPARCSPSGGSTAYAKVRGRPAASCLPPGEPPLPGRHHRQREWLPNSV